MTWKRIGERAPDIRGEQRTRVADAIARLDGLAHKAVADELQETWPGLSEHQVKRLRETFDLPSRPAGRPASDTCRNGHPKTALWRDGDGWRRRCRTCDTARKVRA